jgi:hypothetical protein
MEARTSVRVAGTNILGGASDVLASRCNVLAYGWCSQIDVVEIDELAHIWPEHL